MTEKSSRLIFGACAVVSSVAAMFGMNALPVMAAENVGEEMTVSDGVGDNVGTDTKADTNIDADTSSQTVENVAVNNTDGDVLAGNITDSKPQPLPPTGEIIVGRETAANPWLSVGLEFAGRVRGVRNPVHVW